MNIHARKILFESVTGMELFLFVYSDSFSEVR